jgi:hypothetical protein
MIVGKTLSSEWSEKRRNTDVSVIEGLPKTSINGATSEVNSGTASFTILYLDGSDFDVGMAASI